MSSHATGRIGVRESRSKPPTIREAATNEEKGDKGRTSRVKNGHPSRADSLLRKF